MTDITKYRNVSLPHETYKVLINLSKVLFASSIILLLYLPIILLLIMWNNETPTLLTNKGKNRVGKW